MERLPEWHHLSGHNRQGTIPAVYFCRLFSHLAKEGICASCYSFLVPCACPPLWLWHKAKWIRNGPAASPAQHTAWTWETNLAMPTRLLSSTAPPRRGKLRALKRKRGWAPNLMTRRGNTVRLHGVFIDSLAHADKIFVSYQGTATTEKGQAQSVSNTWSISDGTGKLKGVKGKGSCKGEGNADGSTTFGC